MRRITHKTPLFSLTILVYLLGAALVFSLIDPFMPPARNASDATQHSTYPGSWTDLLGSWKTGSAVPSQTTGIIFTADYKLLVETECATFQGTYLSIIPGHLAVMDLPVTQTRCAFGAEAAKPPLIALKSATGYAAFGNYLQVFDAAGQEAFTFQRAPVLQSDEAAL